MKGRALELELVGGGPAPADVASSETPFTPPAPESPRSSMPGRHRAPADLWLALRVPGLPLLARLEHRDPAPDVPVAVVTGGGTGQRIWRTNAAAASLGIEPGMPLGAAHTLAGPVLRTLERDERAEQALLTRLGVVALRYSPRVSLSPPDILVLEIAGSLKLFGGLAPLVGTLETGLARRLAPHGLGVSLAVAPTPAAAEAFARSGASVRITASEDLVGALAELPIAVLEPGAREAADLERLGVRTVGACLKLPRGGFARRLSPRLLERLDRLTGRMPDPRPRLRLPAHFETAIDLPAATRESGPIVEAARRLFVRLDDHLAAACAVTQRLTWRLVAESVPVDEFVTGLARPSRPHTGQREAWVRLFAERLARRTPETAVTRLELVVTEIETATGADSKRIAGTEDDEAEMAGNWARTLDRLTARLGEHALGVPEILAEYRPERAWRYRPPHAPERGGGVPLHGARPVFLCRPVRALTADAAGRPFWRGPLTLVSVRERIEAGWWAGEDSTRDYYVARNAAGEHCWVCRVLPRAGGSPSWYLQGVFE